MTTARSTTTSSAVQCQNGGPTQPLEPVAVLPATLSDLPCSSETLISLSAICGGLLAETLSGDAMYLAMARAEDDAQKAGVALEEFERVRKIILRYWAVRRGQNPLSKLF